MNAGTEQPLRRGGASAGDPGVVQGDIELDGSLDNPKIDVPVDKPREECGVFGIYAPGEDVARLTFFGLYALQHRGQESAGIAVSDGRTINSHKAMGLVSQVFDEQALEPLKGFLAIGHTRYSTTGSSRMANAQPYSMESY